MNASSVNWKKNRMITLHKNNILPFFLFFYEILDWEIFQAILGNLEEIRIGTGAEVRPQIGSKKTPENGSYIIPFLYFESILMPINRNSK